MCILKWKIRITEEKGQEYETQIIERAGSFFDTVQFVSDGN